MNHINPSRWPILLVVVFLGIVATIGLTLPKYEATLAIGVLIGLYLLCCVTAYPREQAHGKAEGLFKLVGVFAALLCLVVAGLALFTPHKWALIAIGIPWTADRFAQFLYELRDSAQPTP